MHILTHFIDITLHLDKYLQGVINDFGAWTYLILFLIIFCETGLVVTPFLPGDSLLFAVGALAGAKMLSINHLLLLLSVAAIAGDSLNYAIGNFLGPKVFHKEKARFLKKEYLEKTHAFYEKYGAKTIVIARFVPVVRTFAPFVAGVGKMSYLKFLTYNVAGGLLWVGSLMLCGYFFGNLDFVKNNFSAVIYFIIFVSILPGIIEFYKHKRAAKRRS